MLSIDHLIAEDYQETVVEGLVEDHMEPSMAVLEDARAMHRLGDHLDLDPDFAPWTQS